MLNKNPLCSIFKTFILNYHPGTLITIWTTKNVSSKAMLGHFFVQWQVALFPSFNNYPFQPYWRFCINSNALIFPLKDESIDKPFDRNFTMVGPLYMASLGISLNLGSSCVNRLHVKCYILEEIVLDEEVVDKCKGNLKVLWLDKTEINVDHYWRGCIPVFCLKAYFVQQTIFLLTFVLIL